MANLKRGLGRGLSALIPDSEMEIFRRVARDEAAFASEKATKRITSVGGTAEKNVVMLGKSRGEIEGTEGLVTDSYSRNAPTGKNNATAKKAKIESASVSNGFSNVSKEDGGNKDSTPNIETAMIDIKDIEANPYQPRRFFDESELNDLAQSIREHGVIQPIVVRPAEDGEKKYQLVAGERRWRASQKANLLQIPAIVRPIDDLKALELALIENVQRHDISAIDAALAYRRLADEFHLSQEDIARRVGKSRSAVANTLRLLDLQPEIRAEIEEGRMSEGHGRAILLAQGDGARRALFRRIIRDKLSVREVERFAKIANASPAQIQNAPGESKDLKGEAKVVASIDFLQLTARLEKALGTRLSLRHGKKGGRIVIEYSSDEELQRLVGRLIS